MLAGDDFFRIKTIKLQCLHFSTPFLHPSLAAFAQKKPNQGVYICKQILQIHASPGFPSGTYLTFTLHYNDKARLNLLNVISIHKE